MRAAWLLVTLLTLAGCAAGARRHASQPSANQDLTDIQTAGTMLRNGASGAPISGIVVSGEIMNTGSTPLHCREDSFLLVDAAGNGLMPRTQWCDIPSIAPRGSASFTATFSTTQREHLQLRFEHPDGSYEAHDLPVPPV